MQRIIRGIYWMIFCQVVLESLPISSSGHLVLLEKMLQSFGNSPTVADLPLFFDHFLHGPTILVLLIFFRSAWFKPFKLLFKNFSFFINRWTDSYKKLMLVFFKICSFVFITSVMTTVFYFIVQHLKQFAFFNSQIFMLLNFSITTVLLFSLYFFSNSDRPSFDKLRMNGRSRRVYFLQDEKDTASELDYKKVIILGFVQSISFLPGISRFGSTYVLSRWMGVSVRRSFQFTFLMQFPLIVAAFFDASFKLFFGKQNLMSLFNIKVGISFLIATILAYFALRFSYYLAKRRKLWYLGFYMLLPLALLIYFMIF